MTEENKAFQNSRLFPESNGQQFLNDIRNGEEPFLGPIIEDKPLWKLKSEMFNLLNRYPNEVTKYEHAYRIPTTTIESRNIKRIAKANLLHYKGCSTLSIYSYNSLEIPTNHSKKRSKSIASHFTLMHDITTIRTRYSKNKVLSISIHFIINSGKPPTDLYYAVHPPNFDWKHTYPRGKILRNITDNDLMVFFDAIKSAKYYQMSKHTAILP